MTPSAPLVAVDLTPMRRGGEGGGNKVVALAVLRGLRRREPAWRFLLLTTGDNDAEAARLLGPEFERLRVGPVVEAGFLGARGADLLFCPFTPPLHADPWLRLVSVVHDLQSFEYPQFFDPRDVRDGHAHLERLSWLADRIVCVSDFTRVRLVERFPRAAGRAAVVGNAVHARLERLDERTAATLRRHLGIPERPYLLYPANFWAHKNHRLLLLALAALRRRRPDLVVDLVLTGALEREGQDLRAAVGQMALPGVHFPGHVEEKELAALYEGCAAVVFPSLHEGFGIPVLEAMHFGRPVACSDRGALPDVAGGAALLFDPRRPGAIADAMETVLTDGERAEDLATRGLAHAARVREEDMVSGYHDVLAAVLAEAKHVPDAVAGLYSDGWVGPRLGLTFGGGPEGRVWDVELQVPPGLPTPSLAVTEGEGPAARRWQILAGTGGRIQVPLPKEPGRIVLALDPAFQPGEGAPGGDLRWLAALCDTCRLLRPDGSVESLPRGGSDPPGLDPGDLSGGAGAGFRLLRHDRSPLPPAVDGIFADGWTGEFVVVTHGPVESGTLCELGVLVPDWLDAPRTLEWGAGGARSGSCRLAPGIACTVAVPLSTEGGHLTFRVSPVVPPSSTDDTRRLGVLCASCRILGPRQEDGLLLAGSAPPLRAGDSIPRASPELVMHLRRAHAAQGRRLQSERARLAAVIEEGERRLATAEAAVAAAQDEVRRLDDAACAEAAEAGRRLQELEAARARLETHLASLMGSRSWRWTAPLRRLKDRLRGR